MSENKRFSDWQEVDCNDCAHYWDSSCDALQGSRKPCNSFLATRSVIIPLQIKRLQKSVKWLTGALVIVTVAVVILGVMVLG